MAFVLVSGSATPAATPGLVAAYAFDEGSGSTVADASGNGNNGTIANATWVATGKYGGALSFNGSSSRVTVPDSASLHLSSAMTLEAWVDPATTTAAWRDVIYKGNDNYYLEGTSDQSGRPGGGGTFGTIYGTSALPVNTWTHLAVTYDKTTVRLYVNGTQVSTLAATGAIASSTNPLSIGSDAIYGQYFSGLIDDVRVYNTALTASPDPNRHDHPGRAAGPRHDAAVGAGHVDRDRDQQQPRRSQLGRGQRQRRRHRLPHRALPGRRLHQLRRDRHRSRPPATATPPPPPAPATATASAPTTPPSTSAPTPTPPPPQPPAPTRRRRRRRAR